jgi:hypothetical protein
MARIPVPPLHTPMFGSLPRGPFQQLASSLYPAKSAPWAEWYDALTKLLNSVFVEGWVIDRIPVGGITETLIADNAISTPKLQALAVIAEKISVTSLDAISVNAGVITAGTFIGTVFKTAVSGSRIELDTANGFRGFGSTSNVITQIPVTGANAGKVLTQTVQGLNPPIGGTLILTHSDENTKAVVSQTQISFLVSSTERARWDATSSATQTPLLLLGDGSIRRVQIDNADLGSGAKRYLYLA